MLHDIFSAWRSLYPAKYRFFRTALHQLRAVQKNPDGSFVDEKGRVSRVQFRVPAELWLFIKRWMPDFGNDIADIQVLLKNFSDFDTRQKLGTKRIYSTGEKRGSDADKHSDDSSQRSEQPGVLLTQSQAG